MMIGHTQERLTADHKWMQGIGSKCGKGLERDKRFAIPLVNEGEGVVFTSRVVIGKGEECVTIDVKGFYISRPISLKGLQIDKVSP